MTKPIDPESITLHALDRLSPTDAHEAEAAVAQDPELARQLREVEDIAAHLWHASSPLHSAPAEIWDSISEEIKGSPLKKRVVPLPVALVGWAAALVLLAVLLFRDTPENHSPSPSGSTIAEDTDERVHDDGRPKARVPRSVNPPDPGPERSPASPQKLRDQLRRLKERLAHYEKTSKGTRPNIVSLHPPGSSTRRNPKESNTRVISLITEALARDLQRKNEVEVDLVIEQGWDSDLLKEATDEMVLRHRSFLDATADLELLTSEDGRFYDPATEFLWTPAEDGGGYLGQRAGEELDLTAFVESIVTPDPDPDPEDPILAANDDPQGYLVEDPITQETTLLVEKIPPQPPGSELIARVHNANGEVREIAVTPTAPSANPDGALDFLTVPLPPGFSAGVDFEFVATHPDGTNEVILSNDQAGGTP